MRADTVQANAELRRQPDALIGFLRHLCKAELSVRAFNAEASIDEFQILYGRFQHPACKALAFAHYLVRRQLERRTTGDHAALGKGAPPIEELVGIALEHTHLVEAQAEPFRRHLGKHGLVALSMRMGTDVKRDAAVGCDADLHALGLVAGTLAMHGQPDSAAQAAPLTLGAPGRKA